MNSKVLNISRGRTLQELQRLRGDDPDREHREATDILLAHLRAAGETQVADCYDKTIKRCRFFFA